MINNNTTQMNVSDILLYKSVKGQLFLFIISLILITWAVIDKQIYLFGALVYLFYIIVLKGIKLQYDIYKKSKSVIKLDMPKNQWNK